MGHGPSLLGPLSGAAGNIGGRTPRTREAAIRGDLSVMVGCDPKLFDRLLPVLKLMGSDVTHCGEVGSGQIMKILNNMVLFQNVCALTEALAVAGNFNLSCNI